VVHLYYNKKLDYDYGHFKTLSPFFIVLKVKIISAPGMRVKGRLSKPSHGHSNSLFSGDFYC